MRIYGRDNKLPPRISIGQITRRAFLHQAVLLALTLPLLDSPESLYTYGGWLINPDEFVSLIGNGAQVRQFFENDNYQGRGFWLFIYSGIENNTYLPMVMK